MNPNKPDQWQRRGCLAAVSALVLASAGHLQAAEKLESSTSASGPSVNWNTNPAHWERMLEERRTSSAIRIGKSDFTLSGPLVDGVRRQRSTGERSLGKRLLNLPIVRLFVPLPMPSPPGGGPYFRWGERSESWVAISKAPAPLNNTDNPIHREVSGSLISVGIR